VAHNWVEPDPGRQGRKSARSGRCRARNNLTGVAAQAGFEADSGLPNNRRRPFAADVVAKWRSEFAASRFGAMG
jgi:hypothetical protein